MWRRTAGRSARSWTKQAVQTFYLSNAWQQNDLNDVQTALRNVMPNAKVYGVPSQNAIVMRATPDELTLAQKVINDLDKARPEVVVDMAIMEVNKDKLRNIGLSWPGSISFALQPPNTSSDLDFDKHERHHQHNNTTDAG